MHAITDESENKHLMGCVAKLARKCLFHAHFFRRAILIGKVGQTDLVSGVRSGSLVSLCCPSLVCGSARKITSLCMQRLRFLPPSRSKDTHTDIQHFDQLICLPVVAPLCECFYNTIMLRLFFIVECGIARCLCAMRVFEVRTSSSSSHLLATFVPNVVSFMASIAELTHGKNAYSITLTQLLMPRGPKRKLSQLS